MIWLLTAAVFIYNIKTAVRIRNNYFTGPTWARKGHA